MAILNQKRILNLIPKTSAPVTIHVSQGDVGTEIEFTLVKGDELFVNTGGLSASVHGVREDGANFGVFTCTLSGSSVKFPLHAEMTAVKGSAIAEIVLVDSQGNKVGSSNFGIMVEESVFPLGVTYDNDVSVYESILAYVQTIPAQVQGEIADLQNDVNSLNEALATEVTTRQAADTAEVTNRNNAITAAVSAEANTRAAEDATINARIDELVAPSGAAPSAAEVTDARVGADGTTYSSLGAAIRNQISELRRICYYPFNKIYSDVPFIKKITIKNTSFALYALEYIWVNKGVFKYLFRVVGSNDNGSTWTSLGDIDSQTDTDLNGYKRYFNASYEILINWAEYPGGEFNTSSKRIIATNKNDLYSYIDSTNYNTPFVEKDPELSWILDVRIIDTRYEEYRMSYIWKDSGNQFYLFRIEGRNSGGNWTNLGDLSAASSVRPSTLPNTQLISNGVALVYVDWSIAPNKMKLDAVNKVIKETNHIKYDSANYINGLFTNFFNPDLNWLLDIHIADDKYKYYAIQYLWHNVSSYDYLIRIQGSNDKSTWVSIGDIIQETALESEPVIKVLQNDLGYAIVDTSLIPSTYRNDERKILRNSTTGDMITPQLPTGDYFIKDTTKGSANVVVVDVLGNGDFETIADACDYVRSQFPSISNQFEIVIRPGTYYALDVMVPDYTHIHGLAPNSVVVTSEGVNPESNKPVFDQRNGSSKLSNMKIISFNGYCIHFDSGLVRKSLVFENLHLVDNTQTQTGTLAVIGGGSFEWGTKYIWKNCIFESIPGFAEAACHTNVNKIYENTHCIFDGCTFVNCNPRNGNVGGFGHNVMEITNCNFVIGNPGIQSWTSRLRNREDPTLYRFEEAEWQIIGGGNKNFSALEGRSGKTIQLVADYPITISGTAANIIFGADAEYQNVKTSRLNCTLTSEYYIDDSQAGASGYTELKDVYQLWKRLGDCSTTNKTLTVTVNGVSKTYTFNQNYESSKPSEATIIAAMQAVLTNVTIQAITQSGYGYKNVNTAEATFIMLNDTDILKGEFITYDGHKADNSTEVADIAGIVCDDYGTNGNYVKVWTSAFRFDSNYADGKYGLDSNGALSSSAATKVGFVKNNIFYRY